MAKKTKLIQMFRAAALMVALIFIGLHLGRHNTPVPIRGLLSFPQSRTSAISEKPLAIALGIVASSASGESNALHRATSDEILALRRAFMDEFMVKNADARASGVFMFGGHRVDTATPRRARGFAQPHDYETMGGLSPYVVLLKNRPESSDFNQIFGDVVLSSYVPPRGYVLLLSESQLARINGLDSVQQTFEITSEYKIDPFLAWLAEKAEIDAEIDVTIRLFDKADAVAVWDRLKEIGAELKPIKTFDGAQRFNGVAALSQVGPISQIGGVEWVEYRPEMKLNNNLAVLAPRMNVQQAWNDWGLAGEGQIVGHADTGLDTGDTNTLHLDMRGRVTGTATWNGRGAWNDQHLHGTHTAGSIIGNGSLSGGEIKGVAYQAHLFHQSIGTNAIGYLSLPDDLAFLFDEAARGGAYIHSDSWGDALFGLYSSFDEMVDTYVWGNQDFLPVFAAGNEGVDGYYSATNSYYLTHNGIVIPDRLTNGVIDSHSIGAPAMAKNVMAVGATESDRMSGSMSWRTWGSTWPTKYKTNPIKNDIVSIGIVSGGQYHQGMAAFSSRGPTYCGRIKPDVTAPGCDVLSTRYTVGSNYGWGTYAPNPRMYNYYGGTSMACPLAAGAATLVREHLVKREGITTPTAALVKAAMINGAKSIYPGQYGTNGFLEIPATSPNGVEGWGQVNVADALYAPGSGNLFIDRIVDGDLQTGYYGYLDIEIVSTNVPLKAVLVWADYPARPASAYNYELINDLDLLIETPSGTNYWGNGAVDGDQTNTVEKIVIAAPELGIYRVNIIAQNVMVLGSLPALAISGAIDGLQPIVVPQPIADTTPRENGYEAVAHIHSVFPFTVTNPVDFAWAVGDVNSATGGWTHVAVSAEEDGQTYATLIDGPLHPCEVYYVWDVPDALMPITNRFSIVPFEVTPGVVSQTFGYSGGVTNFSVSANTEWVVETTNSWINLMTAGGTNDGAVLYRVETNYVAMSRNGSIFVFGGDVTNAVAVLQTAWNKIPESPQLAQPVFSMSGGEVSVSFAGERNNTYILQGKVQLADPEWTDLETQTVYDNGVVTLTVDEFSGYEVLPDTAFFRIKATPLAE